MDTIAADALTTISEVDGAILAVGAAIVALAAIAMGVRWVKATFF